MKYAHWTTGEVRKLREMHEAGCPRRAVLEEAFPRHPYRSVRGMAQQLGLRDQKVCNVPVKRIQHWLRLAHEYFARRESGLLA